MWSKVSSAPSKPGGTARTVFDPLDVVEALCTEQNVTYERPDLLTLTTFLNVTERWLVVINFVNRVAEQTLLILCSPASIVESNGGEPGGSLRLLFIHQNAGYSPEQVASANEVLLHANFVEPIGSWDRDARDGEIRFRTSASYRGTELTPAGITNHMRFCLAALMQMLKTLGLDDGAPAKAPETLRI
jgi:hypothetical protein